MARPTSDPLRRKLVIVGDGACGKTSLLCVFALGQFPRQYEPTIFENYVAEIRLDGRPVLLALWDTAGQEEYERLRPLSYSHAHIILIAFAIDTPDSLDNVPCKWSPELKDICGKRVPVILVGCKRDLRDQAASAAAAATTTATTASLAPDRYVSQKQGQEMAKTIGAKGYLETSALNNQGVDAVFEAATRAAILVRDQDLQQGLATAAAARFSEKQAAAQSQANEVSGCQCVLL